MNRLIPRDRYVAIALALVVMLVLAACGGEATQTPTPTDVPTLIPAPTHEPAATSIPTPTIQPNPAVEPTVEPPAVFEKTPCPFNLPEGAPVECGFVVVPEDYGDPAGPKIRIAVATFKDQSDGHQPDPVLILAGGPGHKTLHSSAGLAQLTGLLQRDLIAFDQRGVGLSEPSLECPERVEALFGLLDEPDPNVVLKTNFDALIACRDRLVKEGHNLSAYNTVQNAADVNAIRVALGYDEVNLFGGSYGAMLAQAAMRDHPEGIRSVVINSVLPLQKSLRVDKATTHSNAVIRLLDACAADETCATAYPNLQEKLFTLIDRLNGEPLPITVTNPLDGQSYDALLTGDAVADNLMTFLAVTQFIPGLPQAVHNLYTGDDELMTQLSSAKLANYDALSWGMAISVLCTEDFIGRTREDLRQINSTLPTQLTGAANPKVLDDYGDFALCENWPIKEADPWIKEPLVSDIPTLVLEGEFDPITPPEYGRLVADNLTNVYFFEFPGAGHDVLGASECSITIMAAFVDDPSQAPDAACIDEMPGVVFNLPKPSLTLRPITDDFLAQFTSYVEGAMDRFHIPGTAVAVVAGGEIVYAKGFGVRELGKDAPVTPDTLFGIGSMTKSINAMMVASLVDEGYLEWDTPAVEIWPDFQLADPASTSTVTVRDLLSMRTGMRRDDSLWEGKNLSAEELIVALAQVPVAGQPGEQHYYDNQGVATGAYLGVLAAGGELGGLFSAYADLMQERVFGPIGMANTTLNLDSMSAHPGGARPHNWNEAGQPVPSGGFFEGFVPGEGIVAAGGVGSTANDMARYLITQLNRGVSPDGVRVVSAENLTETWKPQISISSGPDAFLDRVWLPSSLYNPVDSQYDYGMGWFVGTYNGVPVVNNPGDQAGWSAHTALLPESDTGIVVLTNANLLPCGAFMKLAVQHRLIELRYGMENQIDGYIDQIADTVREAFGIEC